MFVKMKNDLHQRLCVPLILSDDFLKACDDVWCVSYDLSWINVGVSSS